MKFNIMNRWSGEVQFTAEIDATESMLSSVKIGLAVKWAIETKANLDGANLYGANLYGANLDGANLYGANLDGANLYGANLDGANLDGANLYGANLYGANLYGANLYGANLDGANLDGANLTRANLYGANLTRANLDGANLYGANLYGANLYGAKWGGVPLTKQPIQVAGAPYSIVILDSHMQIGCQLHSLAEWDAFTDRKIAGMDGVKATRFWRDWKVALFAIAKAAGRSTEPVEASDTAAA